MPLTLSDQDLTELQTILGDFRHKEAMTVIQFVAGKQRQQAEQKKAEAATSMANGHADEAQPTAP